MKFLLLCESSKSVKSICTHCGLSHVFFLLRRSNRFVEIMMKKQEKQHSCDLSILQTEHSYGVLQTQNTFSTNRKQLRCFFLQFVKILILNYLNYLNYLNSISLWGSKEITSLFLQINNCEYNSKNSHKLCSNC